LKSLIAALVQAQRPFSEAQKKLVAVNEKLLLSLDEPSLQVLAQQLEVKPETIRAWMKRRERFSSRVKIAVTAEDGCVTAKVAVKAFDLPGAAAIKTRLSALDESMMASGFSRQGDAMVSCVDQDCIMLEEAMHRLTGKQETERGRFFGAPLSILSVSATTLPIFIRLLHEGKMSSDVCIVQPSEAEYLGLSNRNMEPSFLVPNELRLGNDYWSDSVEILYRDAHPIDAEKQKEGVLLLDAVNPRVTTWGNTTDRAEKLVWRKFPRFHCIVLSGTGHMQLSLAGEKKWIKEDELSTFVHDALAESHLDGSDPHSWMAGISADDEIEGDDREDDDHQKLSSARKSSKTKKTPMPTPSVSDLLTAIVKAKGLGYPIAVIGYTRMLRGESFVSSTVLIGGEGRRIVPTHMLCGLAPGRSVEDLVQMAGRVTFTGRNHLDRNMLGPQHDRNMQAKAKVKILISYKDWDLACAYYRFQDQLFLRLKQGESIQDLLDDTVRSHKFDWDSDMRAFMGKRTIGAKKRNNTFSARYTTPGDAQLIKDTFPGEAWALEHGNVECDTKGQKWKLCSPFSVEQLLHMQPMWRDIVDYLYHEKETFQPVAHIIRRAVMLAKNEWHCQQRRSKFGRRVHHDQPHAPPSPLDEDGKLRWIIEKLVERSEDFSQVKVRWKGYAAEHDTWEDLDSLEEELEHDVMKDLQEELDRDGPERTYFTRDGKNGTIDREDLLQDHAKLSATRQGVAQLKNKKAYQRFEPARATNSAKWEDKRTWWQKKGDYWPIFVAADPRRTGSLQNAAQSAAERLILNAEIIKFARMFSKEINSQPPLHKFLEYQRFCVDRGLLPREEDAVEDMYLAESSPAPPTTEQRRRGRRSGTSGESKCSHCGQSGHYVTTCPERGRSNEVYSEGSNKGAGKRKWTEASSDIVGPREVSRTLDMGSPSSAAEDGASQQDLDMELPASRRKMTKHEKALAELAFSNPGVKAAVAAVAQSPPSSSAGIASSRLTRARNCAEGWYGFEAQTNGGQRGAGRRRTGGSTQLDAAPRARTMIARSVPDGTSRVEQDTQDECRGCGKSVARGKCTCD